MFVQAQNTQKKSGERNFQKLPGGFHRLHTIMEHHDDLEPPVASKVSGRSLTREVPQRFLRGVQFRDFLALGGQSFNQKRSHIPLKPCKTAGFDTFISHDWQTSAWLKYGALLLLLNAKAAAIATLLVSITFGVLIEYEVVPLTPWALSIGYLTFLIVLLFWQNFQDVFFQPRIAFLDSLTIPQDDEALKEECILALSGFLACSKKLTILWSESYSDRLWCIYEFAAFMRNARGRPVQAIPVTLPLLLALHAVWWLACRILTLLLWQALEISVFELKFGLTFSSLCLMYVLTCPFQYILGMRMTKNLEQLRSKLHHFRIQDAKCSCCTKGHKTQSGEEFPCDRELIYQSFQEWYGANDDMNDMQTALEAFNQAVRNQLGDEILKACGGRQMIPLHLFIYVVFSTSTPFLITRIPIAFAQAREHALTSTWSFCVVVLRDLLRSWAQFFLAMLSYLWASKITWSNTHDACWRHCASMVFSLFAAATPSLAFLALTWTSHDNWYPLVSFPLLMCFALWLLSLECGCKQASTLVDSTLRDSPASVHNVEDNESDSFSI